MLAKLRPPRFPRCHDRAALGAERLGEKVGLRRLSAPVDSLESDEHLRGRIRTRPGERTRSVESSYVPTIDAARWRTATIIACAVAALELGLLVAIGVALLGKSAAHRVREAAIANVAGVQAIPLEEARKTMGPLADALTLDQLISARKASTELGWMPKGRSVLKELTGA